MTLKPLVSAMVMCAGLTVSATSVSAQDWWNPGSWFVPRPAYGYSYGYGGAGPSCSGGVCRPGRLDYGTGYAPYGDYGYGYDRLGCGPNGCRNGSYRNRVPNYAPTVPEYHPYVDPRSIEPAPVPDTWGSYDRGRINRRPNYSPYYE